MMSVNGIASIAPQRTAYLQMVDISDSSLLAFAGAPALARASRY
jgi:hypothetical protein